MGFSIFDKSTIHKQLNTITMKKKLLLVAILAFTGIQLFAKDGVYLEFKITSPRMNGTSKTYEAGGSTRTEMLLANAAGGGPMGTTTLILADNPHNSYSLDEKNKTYTVTETGKNGEHPDDYDVEVVGKEKINNYKCTHVVITFKKFQRKSEMWLSKDVPGYASFIGASMSQMGGGSGFYDKLKAKGADGFVVRMLTKDSKGGEGMQMDLVKAEKKNIDPSLFSLSGYTKSSMPVTMTNEQMRAMTPAQRQEYLNKMREKYKR